MQTDHFVYWLQGFAELHGAPPTATQWQQIKDHLALVFRKETPNRLEGLKLDGGVEPKNELPTYCGGSVAPLVDSNLLCGESLEGKGRKLYTPPHADTGGGPFYSTHTC